jgi:hypothetical protein
MLRNLAFAIGPAAFLVLFAPTSVSAQAQFGSEQEARGMLDRAVGALKEDKAKALEMFNKGEGGFRDRDLYVFCANASDGVLAAHPYLKGEHLQDIVGKKGYPLGEEIMRTATEGRIDQGAIGGPAPVRTSRWRSTAFIPRSWVKTAASATTRNDDARKSLRRMVGEELRAGRTPPVAISRGLPQRPMSSEP